MNRIAAAFPDANVRVRACIRRHSELRPRASARRRSRCSGDPRADTHSCAAPHGKVMPTIADGECDSSRAVAFGQHEALLRIGCGLRRPMNGQRHEVLGALLLLFRRTTALGAAVLAVVLVNVVMMNFCYDVPVKINGVHYLGAIQPLIGSCRGGQAPL